ncbi:MAG: hypothetical protein WBA23_00885 [Tunicatimonas sp.]|uniref:hypothetical protein n=1 Tax=Tunicatimonas sp. TaxID=1940096 RepID=UPI003C7079AF
MKKMNYHQSEERIESFLDKGIKKARRHPGSKNLKASVLRRMTRWQYQVGFQLRNTLLVLLLIAFLLYGTYLLIQVIENVQSL